MRPELVYRYLELGRGAWGAALLIGPRQVLTSADRALVDAPSVLVARILGGRQLVQAMLSGIRPSPEVLAMGVWVDVVHAVTAAILAVADRRRIRAGLIDCAVAAVWAVLGYRDLTAGPTTPFARQHRRDQLARGVLGIAPGGRFLLHRVRRP